VSPNGSGSAESTAYELAFREVGVGLALISRTESGHRIVDYNRAAERAFGRGESGLRDAAGCELADLLPGAARFGLLSKIDEAIDTQTPIRVGAFELQSEEGPRTVFAGQLIPLEDEQLLISFENITDRVEAPARTESNLRIESLNALAVRVARDLSEPIASIKLAAELLCKDESQRLPYPAGEYVSHIRASVRSMKERLDDVLMLARIRDKPLAKREVNLTGLVRAVVAERGLDIRALKAKVDVGRLATITGDAALLRQLFSNLISNALKFRRDDAAPQITIRSEGMPILRDDAGRMVRVSITDNGIGFSRELARHIFTMFEEPNQQGSAAAPSLSLGLCRLIVEKHGGRIWATGTPGVGARFTIELPRRLQGQD
jgi:signal transduction histidine kinase